MIRRKKENIQWLEFELLQPFPEVVHGVFTRHGGLSFTEEGSLSLVSKLLSLSSLEAPKQVHSDVVEIVPPKGECDGLITAERGVGLLIRHADCQAAIFFDPKQKVIANVHCGWRGNVQNIYAKTMKKLKELGCKPEDLLVCISPSLGPENAEFIHHEKELPESFRPFQVKENYFDFWKIAKMQLEEEGVLEKNIEIAKICTFSAEEDFFSYRRDTKTGRNATVVSLSKL